jgi:hypothetical protein
MVTAVNLDQLAGIGTSVTGLMNFWAGVVCGDPESGFYHEASDGFLAKDQTMNFLELFPCVWFGNVEKVAAEKIGVETVTYVSNIYKYYIAYRLVTDELAGKEKAVEQSTSKATSLKMPQAKSIVAPLRTEPQPFWKTTQKAAPGKNACRTTML